MKKRLRVWFIVFGIMALGFLSRDAMSFEWITQTEKVTIQGVAIDIVKTAENFLVLYDASSSMGAPFEGTGMTKLEAVKKALKERNERLPSIHINAGLYTYSQVPGAYSLKALKPYYDVKPYDKAEFARAIDQLPDKASGPALLREGLLALDRILAGLKGHTAIFLFTDGNYNAGGVDISLGDRRPADIARRLAQKYNVSFWVISSATGQTQKQLLKAVASVSNSSRVIPVESFVDSTAYLGGALFVLQKRCIENVITNEKIIGAKVDHILFDYDKSNIKPEYNEGLNTLGRFLEKTPQAYVIFAGFTDSKGSDEYNMGLSKRRAESVAMYLLNNFKIDPDRVDTLWYGKAAPVAGNDTDEGRSQNRRVETVVANLP